MKRISIYLVLLVGVVSAVSCNKNLDKVLFGTWTVTKVEGDYIVNGTSVFTAQDTVPTGTIEFKTNGTGHQNYTFFFGGTTYTMIDDFKWEANDDEIIVNRVDDTDMIWTRVLDTETKQIATFTTVINADESRDFTLTLEK